MPGSAQAGTADRLIAAGSFTGRVAVPDLHPAIRILCLLAVASLAGQTSAPALLCAGGGVLVFYVTAGIRPDLELMRRLLRLRWLLFSILLVYLLFTPGEPLIRGWRHAPSLAGAQEGLARCSALLLLLLMAHWLRVSTARDSLVQALLWLLRPIFGRTASERLALRLVLTLEAADSALKAAAERAQPEVREAGWRGWEQRAAELVEDALARAERAPDLHLSLVPLVPPPWIQWLLPAGIALAGLWLGA